MESIYNSSDMIGISEVGPNVREITLLDLLREGGALKGIPQHEIDTIKELSIVWELDGIDVNVFQIYNPETGEVYWEDHDENWTDGDELILNSLLMYGELEWK